MAKSKGQIVEVDGRELKLTNLDKVLYPEVSFTKGEVIDYYTRIAPAIVPHLEGRAVTLKRYPEGVDREGTMFYEKRCPKHRPDWVKTVHVPLSSRGGDIDFCCCDDLPTLVWMAQIAALELHPSLSPGDAPDTPSFLAFDLDPGPPADIIDCCRLAMRIREMFGRFEIECFPKTSGSKGMQVYVPINEPKATYDDTKPLAKAIAQLLEKQTPELVVSKMSKELREGKIFVDWSQNHRRKTTISVYSLRARPEPTVSTPISWDEVEAAEKKGDPSMLVFRTDDVLKRFEQVGDLFAPVLSLQQSLPDLA